MSIFRPGILLNRDNDERFVEKILRYVPFAPKVESKVLSKAMLIDAENI
jgi:hypothetical protein